MARTGGPQAVQVADRFHLPCNLGDVVRRVLLRHATLVGHVRMPGRGPSLASLRPERAAARGRTREQMADCHAALHSAAAQGL